MYCYLVTEYLVLINCYSGQHWNIVYNQCTDNWLKQRKKLPITTNKIQEAGAEMKLQVSKCYCGSNTYFIPFVTNE